MESYILPLGTLLFNNEEIDISIFNISELLSGRALGILKGRIIKSIN